MKRTVVLIILDGWGVGEENQANPLHIAKPKLLEFLPKYYLSGSLAASGMQVGLPWAEESNSEVGHLTLGSGRIIYHHLVKINHAIEDGSFYSNKVLQGAVEHVRKNNSTLHIAGLLTDGSVHASIYHLQTLIKFSRDNDIPFSLHLFADGKDTDPKAAIRLLKDIDTKNLSSIAGRYYGMDRDNHWERTEKAYKNMMGEGKEVSSSEEEINLNYDKGFTDQHIHPFFMKGSKSIQNKDAILFFNFREDSMRQITESFISTEFEKFERKKLEDMYIASMTEYSHKFQIPVLFPPEDISNTLGETVSKMKKTQLRLAETAKYAHVTYFFNAYEERPYPGEFRVLIPSQNVASHDERPEMRVKEISARLIEAIEERSYDLIVVNIANFDMIAHTGNFDAALKTIKVVDSELEKIWKTVIENRAVMIMTADHGNIEVMLNTKTWEPETKHDPSPVPIYVIGEGFESVDKEKHLETVGLLSDIAPTILSILEIEKPPEMTGQNLLPFLK